MSVLELISHQFSSIEAETMTESSGTASEGSRHASQTPYENSSSRDHPTIFYVEISVQPSTSPVPIIHFISNDIATPPIICLAPSAVPAYQGHSVSRNSQGSVVRILSNTVEFTSPCARFLMFTAMVHIYRSTRRTFHSSAFHRRCKVLDGFIALKLPRPSGKRSARKKVDNIFLPSIYFLTSIHFIRTDAVHDPAATDPNSVVPIPECRTPLLCSSRIGSILSRNLRSIPLRSCRRT